MPIAAAAYALLIAVSTLTSGAPSILSISLVTPDSSTATTVIGTDNLRASATAASIISLDASLESVGRVIWAAFTDIWSDLLRGWVGISRDPMIRLQQSGVQFGGRRLTPGSVAGRWLPRSSEPSSGGGG